MFTQNNSQTDSETNPLNLQKENNNYQTLNSSKLSKNNWPKQIYYYLILAGCLFALAIAGFTFLRANLVRYIFPDVDNYSYSSYPMDANRCKYKNDPYSVSPIASLPKNLPQNSILPTEMPKAEFNSPEEVKVCEKNIKDEKDAQTNRQYQTDMLNSILTITISSLVLFGHLKFFKNLEV